MLVSRLYLFPPRHFLRCHLRVRGGVYSPLFGHDGNNANNPPRTVLRLDEGRLDATSTSTLVLRQRVPAAQYFDGTARDGGHHSVRLAADRVSSQIGR